MNINRSLLALGNCINALADKTKKVRHIYIYIYIYIYIFIYIYIYIYIYILVQGSPDVLQVPTPEYNRSIIT